MAPRRILSLWFPRLAAERHLRRLDPGLPLPLAVVGERGGAQVLASVSAAAEAAGLRPGQALRDATAVCPALLTRPEDAPAEAAFLTVLRRWAGRFSPRVAEEPPDALVIDISGCAHLFGGEAALLAEAEADAARLGLTLRAGIADTPGAAWALARHAGRGAAAARTGDAIVADARATRSRAARRGAVAPAAGPQGAIAPPGTLAAALAPLPLAALRLPPGLAEDLARLGLRRVGEVMGMPRAALARRFGTALLRRIDQATGVEPEPVTPAAAPLHFAVRLTLPDPIGLRADVEAAVDRLLPALCDRLAARGRGARVVRLEAFRAEGGVARVEIGLARAAAAPGAIRPLLALKLDGLDAGFGFDAIRLSAPRSEPLHARQMAGHAAAAAEAARRQAPAAGAGAGAGSGAGSGAGADADAGPALADLIGRLGARLGSEAVLRLHPAESHIPEKAAIPLQAAWSDPAAGPWPPPRAPRPLIHFAPEPVTLPDTNPAETGPPAAFRWRRRDWRTARATGPERIAPEWWLDDPAWRSGARDYWRIETETGDRLWLFRSHGAAVPGGWFCQGRFA